MKDKIYYFQEKSNDILDLQDELTAEEIGIYFILKAGYFKYAGELREENLCQRCKFFGNKEKLDQVKNKIFEVKEGLLVNNAWLSEIKTIQDRSIKRREAAMSRWSPEEESKTEASDKQKVANASKSKQKVANIVASVSELPIFINKNLLDDFAEMRKKIKKPLTAKARELIIKKLSEFEKKKEGSANKSLENSIENSWQGVFEPKDNNSNQPNKSNNELSRYDYLLK